jgi:DNA-directed RNA polymerase specialized sigma subunit
MEEVRRIQLFELLEQKQTEQAWPLFLQLYSDRVLRIVRRFAKNEDDRADCFLFVCEQLHRKNCRRLRKFDPAGPAMFTTWLHAVTFNLCRDWRRTKFPRYRIFRSISGLPDFEQEIFHCHFERGMNLQETLEALRYTYPHITRAEVADAAAKLQSHITSRQRRLLLARRPKLESLSSGQEGNPATQDLPDNDRSSEPEVAADRQQLDTALNNALKALEPGDLLILRLRFQRDLSLAEIATLTGVANAQAVDRQIQKIVEALRQKMTSLIGGNTDDRSV